MGQNIGNQIYYIDYPLGSSPTAAKLITPNISTGQTNSECPLTCTLELQNSSSVYELQGGSTWSWLQSFTILNTGQIAVYTADYATYHPLTAYPNTSPWTDLNLRVTLKDDYSQSAQKQVQETFILSIRRPCSDATLTKTNTLSAFTYYINTGDSSEIKQTYSITKASGDPSSACTPLFYLHFQNSASAWIEYNSSTAATYPYVKWNAASGSLVINTSDFSADTTTV